METALAEKVGKAKGEKKCSQFIMLCRCYSKYSNALEGVDGGDTHLPPPLWRVGEKKGVGKWRFLLKKLICGMVGVWNFGFLFLPVCINTVTYLLSEVSYFC